MGPLEALLASASLKTLSRIERWWAWRFVKQGQVDGVDPNVTTASSIKRDMGHGHGHTKWTWLYRISLRIGNETLQWNILLPSRDSMDLFESYIRKHCTVVEDDEEDLLDNNDASTTASQPKVVLRVMDD